MSYIYEALSPGGHQAMLEEVFKKFLADISSYKTVSGSLVSFADGADLPMPSFICNIDAVQDLHGYDGPWVGGAGKNKCPVILSDDASSSGYTATVENDGVIIINGTWTGTANNIIGSNEQVKFNLPAGSYVLSGATVDNYNDYGICLQVLDWGTSRAIGNTATTGYVEFTLEAQTEVSVRVFIYNNKASGKTIPSGGIKLYPMIRLATVTDSTFAPYSNICPISGHTGVDAWVRGKNLLPMTVEGIKAANTNGTWSGNNYTWGNVTYSLLTDEKNNIIGVKVNGTATEENRLNIDFTDKMPVGNYYASGCADGGSNTTFNVYFWNSTTNARIKKWDGTTISESLFNSSDNAEIQIPNTTDTLRYIIRVRNGCAVNNLVFTPMVRPSTDTDATYTPYNSNSQTIQVSWQTEAGEVFGGYVDFVSGVLTVTHKSQTRFTRGVQDSTHKLYHIGTISDIETFTSSSNISPYFIDNMFAKMSLVEARATETSSITHVGKSLHVGGYIGKEAELDTLLETLQVVYELETPITYQLTPTQIKSLKDDITNAWCSTGDIKTQYQPNNIIAELRAEILALQERVEELEQTE